MESLSGGHKPLELQGQTTAHPAAKQRHSEYSEHLFSISVASSRVGRAEGAGRMHRNKRRSRRGGERGNMFGAAKLASVSRQHRSEHKPRPAHYRPDVKLCPPSRRPRWYEPMELSARGYNVYQVYILSPLSSALLAFMTHWQNRNLRDQDLVGEGDVLDSRHLVIKPLPGNY